LFDENLLHAAVVNRINPDFIRPSSDEPMVWFDHFYRVITSRSAAEQLDTGHTSPP
jgi:hypothetical protein